MRTQVLQPAAIAPLPVQVEVRTGKPVVDRYLSRLQSAISDLTEDQRTLVMARAMAEIELDTELEPTSDEDASAAAVLQRLGEPEVFAGRLRTVILGLDKKQETALIGTAAVAVGSTGLAPCRTCGVLISKEARTCPHCGAPNPVIAAFLQRAYGYEWRTKQSLLGYPLIHVAFGRDKNGKVRVAKGVVAVGQFGIGAFTIAQFGIGYIAGIGEFMFAPLALGQLALGLVAIGQFGIGAIFGMGQIATGAKAIGEIVFHLLPHK